MDRALHVDSSSNEEIPLFFYPEHVNIDQQVQLIQIASGITGDWAANFTKSNVSVVEFKQVKFAYKEVAEYTMVLSGDVKDSNYALAHHMDLIWDCLQFYCGSFQRLAEKGSKNRKALQKIFKRTGSLLEPLIRNFHNVPMKFSNIPYLQVSQPYKNTSAHFIVSWQLLNNLSLNENVEGMIYGAALIFNASVVCSQLDVNSTRWITNLIECKGGKKHKPKKKQDDIRIKTEEIYAVFASTSSLKESLVEPPDEELLPVPHFISKSERESNTTSSSSSGTGLIGNNTNIDLNADVSFSEGGDSVSLGGLLEIDIGIKPQNSNNINNDHFTNRVNNLNPTTNSNTKARQKKLVHGDEAEQQEEEEEEEGSELTMLSMVPGRTRAGLYIVQFSNGLSISILLTWSAYSNEESVKKIYQVIIANSALIHKLCHLLNKVTSEPKQSRNSIGDNMEFPPAGPGPSVAASAAVAHHHIQQQHMYNFGGSSSTSSSSTGSGTASNTGGPNTNTSQYPYQFHYSLGSAPRPYNFFTIDSVTELQHGTRGIHDPEIDANFSQTINWAHDLFTERPESSKLVLQNYSGSIFCRKQLGKETFFQLTNTNSSIGGTSINTNTSSTSNNTYALAFEDFEDAARKYLSTNHNINFI